MSLAGNIRNGRVGQINLLGAPGGRRIGPGFISARWTDLTTEKRQLESIKLAGLGTQITGVIPPFGAVPRMRAVVFREFEVAGTGDG